jgi:hypothetical protein
MERHVLSIAQVRWLAVAFALAFVSALVVTAERPALAQVVSCAGPATAGSAVEDLYGESLGTLAHAVTPIDCDGTYYLIPWDGDGVALVAMPMMVTSGVHTKFGGGKSIACGGPDDGALCKGAAALASKVEQWRNRYGEKGKKKKKP